MRELIDVYVATRDGVAVIATTGDPVNHHSVDNNVPRVALRVENTDVSNPQTITISTPYQRDGLDLEERAIAIPASTVYWIGVFDNATYGGVDNDNALTKNALLFSVSDATLLIEALRTT